MLCFKKKAELVDKFYGDSAVVIGDTESDEELAVKIGSKFFAVENGLRDKKYLHADYYAKDFCLLNIERNDA